MQTNCNTVLVTSGGLGIGRGLAEAFHHLGNQVIITLRRQAVYGQEIPAAEIDGEMHSGFAGCRNLNSDRSGTAM